jgi:hypothetical protein
VQIDSAVQRRVEHDVTGSFPVAFQSWTLAGQVDRPRREDIISWPVEPTFAARAYAGSVLAQSRLSPGSVHASRYPLPSIRSAKMLPTSLVSDVFRPPARGTVAAAEQLQRCGTDTREADVPMSGGRLDTWSAACNIPTRKSTHGWASAGASKRIAEWQYD